MATVGSGRPDVPGRSEPAQRSSSRPSVPMAVDLRRIDARKARFRAFMTLISVLLLLGTAVIVAVVLVRGAAPRPRLDFVRMGSLEKTYPATALIVRDESVYLSNAKGFFRPMATEGSRVPANGLLAYVTPQDGIQTLKDLQNIDQQIADLQRDLLLRGKGQAARAIFDETDQNLSTLAERIRRTVDRSDLNGVSRIAASIGILIELRNSDLATVDFNDSRLDQLQAEKSALETSLGLESASMSAVSPGIVAYETDGLEGLLTSASVDTLRADEVQGHFGAVSRRADTTRELEVGTPVLKTIAGPYQYFVLLATGVDASAFLKGNLQTLRFPTDGTGSIQAQVWRAENTETGALLVFRTDLLLERFSDRRAEPVVLVRKSEPGLKVPVASFVVFDRNLRTATLKIVTGGYVRLSEVRVLDYDREDAVVVAMPGSTYAIEENGILVVEPGSIAEGEAIG